MSRIVLSPGQQAAFLKTTRRTLGGQWRRVAEIAGCNPRTVRGWLSERWQMSEEAAARLERATGVVLPRPLRVLPEFWSTSKGGSARAKLWNAVHGNPGTPDSRTKGGLVSQQRRREAPEQYFGRGFRKPIRVPGEDAEFAEFVGIVLGDGTISRHQVRVTLNRTTDRAYAGYVAGLARRLFDLESAVTERPDENALYLTLSSTNLVELLVSTGLCRGNKIHQQVDVPGWALRRSELARACIRGLVDTDGSLYCHGPWFAAVTTRTSGWCLRRTRDRCC